MRMFLIVFVATATVASCGAPSPYSRYSYEGSSYAPYSTDNYYGCNNNAGLLGGLAGAAGGGLLGNQFGHGTGKGLATGAGVLGGAAAGYAMGRSLEGC